MARSWPGFGRGKKRGLAGPGWRNMSYLCLSRRGRDLEARPDGKRGRDARLAGRKGAPAPRRVRGLAPRFANPVTSSRFFKIIRRVNRRARSRVGHEYTWFVRQTPESSLPFENPRPTSAKILPLSSNGGARDSGRGDYSLAWKERHWRNLAPPHAFQTEKAGKQPQPEGCTPNRKQNNRMNG